MTCTILVIYQHTETDGQTFSRLSDKSEASSILSPYLSAGK
ncbi:unnamed protein product [Penicillium salamii]|nr:unnamed protein product [Penicillium salamii]CAG8179895.1 unnamed protein product [Penicillium salamii]